MPIAAGYDREIHNVDNLFGIPNREKYGKASVNWCRNSEILPTDGKWEQKISFCSILRRADPFRKTTPAVCSVGAACRHLYIPRESGLRGLPRRKERFSRTSWFVSPKGRAGQIRQKPRL